MDSNPNAEVRMQLTLGYSTEWVLLSRAAGVFGRACGNLETEAILFNTYINNVNAWGKISGRSKRGRANPT
jgi:hypothetical protein